MPAEDTASETQNGSGPKGNIPVFMLGAIAAAGGIVLLRFAQDLFIPIALAVLVAYALNPLVSGLVWLRIPRAIGAAVVIIGMVAVVGGGIFALRRQAVAALETLPVAAQRVRQKIEELRQKGPSATSAMSKLQEAAKEIEKTAAEATGPKPPFTRGVTRVQIEEPTFRANDYLLSGSMGMLTIFGQAAMVCFLVFFLLASGDLFKRKLVRVIGTKLSHKRVTLETINEVNSGIERFLLIQAATGVLVGACTSLFLWFYGVHQPGIWGVAAGILNSVPYFGAILVTLGLALIAFLQFGSILDVIYVASATFAISSLEGLLLTPFLMGKAARINGVAMFLSLLFWSWLWGVIGMIVAVPMMMVVKSVCDRIESLQPFGELLGE